MTSLRIDLALCIDARSTYILGLRVVAVDEAHLYPITHNPRNKRKGIASITVD